MSEENPLDFLKKYEDDYKKAQEKVECVNSLPDIAIEKNTIEAEIQKNHPEFVNLVRKRIDLDGKKWNAQKEINELQIRFHELKIKNPENLSALNEIEEKIQELEKQISDIETEEMLINVDLDPLDKERSDNLLVAQVLEEKSKNAFKDIQN